MTDPLQVPAQHDAAAAPTNHASRPRLPGLDVTRAVALIGVVILNYHGYLNNIDERAHMSLAERIFDPHQGPLGTRFAAVFVMVAGMGVTLMTNRSRQAGHASAIRDDRWRLARRGLLLYAGGLLLEWVWPGTILFYYGALFMVASLLFTLRLRWIALVGAVSSLAAAGVAWFEFERVTTGHSVAWLNPKVTSPRNLLLRTFVGYTHPLFPWLALLCVGIAVGRFLPLAKRLRLQIIAVGMTLLAGTYLLNHFGVQAATGHLAVPDTAAQRWALLLSTRPFDRGLLYTLGTIGSSLIAFCVVSWVADRTGRSWPVRILQHAGQMTLTLYVGHALVFNAVVHWWHWVGPTGLDTALVFALIFWVYSISLAALWHRYLGAGPLERVYRGFGG
ncbi:unannotated protein [freshwater metagenome]|uniref:Unannotated protein n=1 Tax=freshwater metagenome TaxID=449393 RepID=A0A6J7EJL9_9ZZZZ|nr:DUF418 domain-containing protein [Actinomycetota bacterium]